MGKISKSRGGGPMPPIEMIQRYSADAVRYWAASTGTGKDSIISEEKIQMGEKLVTKLWNVGRFSETFLTAGLPVEDPASFTPADRWILARLQTLIRRVTQSMNEYEYAAAKNEVETFFWKDLADNYLEMAKQRLYSPAAPGHGGATFTLYLALLTALKLLAPFLPYVTDAIYRSLFAVNEGPTSIHRSAWSLPQARFEDPQAEQMGETLVSIATAVRRFKSERSLSLGSELNKVQLAPTSPALAQALVSATSDLMSVTRARQVEITARLDSALVELTCGEGTGMVKVGLEEMGNLGAMHVGN